MKSKLLLISILCAGVSFGQTELYHNDFEKLIGFTLNSTDLSSTSKGENPWIINNVYEGGDAAFMCVITDKPASIPFTVPTTPMQPIGINDAPNSNYLHVSPQIAINAGGQLAGASYVAADGIGVLGNECTFTKMTSDISTIGFDSVTIDFWWMCGGSADYYGEVYYSIDEGLNWIALTCPTMDNTEWRAQSSWMNTVISNVGFANQPTLRLGYRFVSGSKADETTDPGFSIDDISITGFDSNEPKVDADKGSNVELEKNVFGDAVKVYPNPTEGQVNIQLSAEYTSVQVIVKNIEGKIISSRVYSETRLINLNLEGENGVYLVEVIAGDKRQHYRVIKQ